MKQRWVATVAVAATLFVASASVMAACGGDDDEAASTATSESIPTTTESATTTTETATTTAAQPPAPPKPARAGYAAPKEAWLSLRDPDPDPQLEPACCFLPKQENGLDRYIAVFYDENDLAYTYTMNFAPSVSEPEARVLLRDEFPNDSRVVGRKEAGRCLFLGYRSNAAKRAIGYSNALVALYSGDEGNYTGIVSKLIIVGGLSVADGVC